MSPLHLIPFDLLLFAASRLAVRCPGFMVAAIEMQSILRSRLMDNASGQLFDIGHAPAKTQALAPFRPAPPCL